MNVSQYCALQSQKPEIIVFDDTLKELLHQLSKVDGNLNQALILAHQGQIDAVDIGYVKKEIHEIWQYLNSSTEKTRRIQG